MYNEKNMPFGMEFNTPALPSEGPEEPRIPRLNEQIGGRRCDGTMPDEEASHTHGWGLSNYPLAMVYSPYQHFKDLYSIDKGLERGTIFAELDLPFEGYKR